LHHFVSDPAKEQGIGLRKALGPETMQFFVRGTCTMIDAAVQCDVDGIPKGSHYVHLKWPNETKISDREFCFHFILHNSSLNSLGARARSQLPSLSYLLCRSSHSLHSPFLSFAASSG